MEGDGHGPFEIMGLICALDLGRAADAEAFLLGQEPSAHLFEEAARRATAGIDPPADLHGSAEYRKKVAATLVRRGLRAAADNAHERQ